MDQRQRAHANADMALRGPSGTSGLIGTKDVVALVGHLTRVQEEGLTWSLGCGCTNGSTCGYHADQKRRTPSRDASPVTEREDSQGEEDEGLPDHVRR